MTALSDTLAVKVSKIIGQFGSDNPHVVTTAAAMLQRTLSSNGCDLNDLAEHIVQKPQEVVRYIHKPQEPPRPGPRSYGDWRQTYRDLDPRRRHKAQVTKIRAAPHGFLSPWESEFVGSLARQLDQGRNLSCRQETILRDIHARFEERFG